ncbi:TPA: hypothetical protein ACN1KO_001056 [Klebsiella pneumoniae]
MTTDIELAQSLKRRATSANEFGEGLFFIKADDVLALVEALEKEQQRIEELESDLSEWTDCKHDGATYYDMSGRERCGRCGEDI